MEFSHNFRIFLVLLNVSLFSIALVFYDVVIFEQPRFRDVNRGASGTRNLNGTFIPYGEPVHPDLMMGCPDGWPLEVTVRVRPESEVELQQVCTNKVENKWTCAKDWEKHQTEPKCVPANGKFPYKPPGNVGSYKRTSARRPESGYISDKHKILFINIPSNDDRVIETSLLFNDMRQSGRSLGEDYKITDFDEEFFKTYFKFAMIRHPCSRLLSGWYNNDNGTRSSFETLLETLHRDGQVNITGQSYLQTQVRTIFDSESNFGLDQLLVFERWNQSIDLLGKKLKVDLSSLKRSRSPIKCRDVYTRDMWEKLVKIYWIDFCVLGYSMDIDLIDPVPLLSPKPTGLDGRFQNCFSEKRRPNINNKSSGLQSKNKPLKNNSSKQTDLCAIHTYFQPSRNATPEVQMASQKTIDAWKEAWTIAGWKPRVLEENDAKSHPQYLEFRRKFEDLPTINPKEYEISCLMRHVAMAAVGGGWMTDYDILPFYIPPCLKPLNNGSFTVYQGYVPCLVSGTGDEFTRVATRMADADWKENPTYSAHGKPHVSDMLVTRALYLENAIHSMRVTVEANKLFESPSICDQHLSDRNMPDGLPKRSWAIHYSHVAIRGIQKLIAESSTLWPGSLWNLEPPNKITSKTRGDFMTDSIKYIFQKCNCTTYIQAGHNTNYAGS